METVYDIRRQNAVRWFHEHGHGSRIALAAKMNITPAAIGHWIRDPKKGTARPIHEDTARALEKAMGLEPGELDWPGGKRPSRASVVATAVRDENKVTSGASTQEIDANLLRACTEEVLVALHMSHRAPNNQQLAHLVTLTFQDAMRKGRVDKDYLSQLLALML